jgi:2'-5' RNA ligase
VARMRRLFLALAAPELPRVVEDRIDAALQGVLGARRTQRAMRHITLAFLGDIAEERIPSIVAAMRNAASRADRVPYAFDRLGGFPGRTARILALTGETPKALMDLAANLGGELKAAGLPVDPKPFRLHLTVARLREPSSLPVQTIEKVSGAAEEIRLYESELLSAGAHYTLLETSQLLDALHTPPGLETEEGGD